MATSPRVSSLLQAENVWYVIRKKKTDKIILQNVSVTMQSGEVLAIMGPSGAGKTMFLNALTLQRGPGQRYGTVDLNGQRFSNHLFQRYCAIVTQLDLQWAFLTCKQALMIAAGMFISGDSADKAARVDDLVRRLGLDDCVNTRIGNALIPGMAFGQRRRLSLATVLLKRPLAVFLDEPTTNLDSASAAGIMKHLKGVARDLNIIVVCTIHQPDKNTFDGFDQLLLLSDGRVAYRGAAASAIAHFDSLGRPVPKGENPADYMLDLLNKAFTDPTVVDNILQEWADNPRQKAQGAFVAADSLPKTTTGANLCVQMGALFKRHGLLFFRDPILYIGRAIMMMFTTCFFALTYIETRNRRQDQSMNLAWFMMWTIGVPNNLAVIAAFALNLEFVNVKFEVMGGMYKMISYIVAHSIFQVFSMVLFAVCSTGVSGFAIGDWNSNNYFPIVSVYAVLLFSFECVAQLNSVSKNHPILAMLDFMNYWFSAFLFCGLMLPPDDVIWPFRALTYILPMKYSITALMYFNYEGTTWAGAEPISQPPGFMCPDLQGMHCVGYTGKQVLASMEFRFPTMQPDPDLLGCFMAMLAAAVCFKVLFIITAYVQCRSVTPPKPLPDDIKANLEESLTSAVPTAPKQASLGGGLDSDKVSSVSRDPAKKSRMVMTLEQGYYGTKKKDLLKDCSCCTSSGELLTVMGPSGAGKSLFLNMLSLVPGQGRRFGHATLNGQRFSQALFRKYGSQILQTDFHWPFMTPREQMMMAADLYKAMSKDQKGEIIDKILKQLGLEGCQNTRIGNQFIPGCSGGQRRRVSIAMAMLKDPLVFFLDEPTAGLDSAAARNIMMTLKELAVTKDIIAICSLSQPNTTIFNLIDQLLLVTEGRVAYSGPAKSVVQYFASVGHRLPDGDNPAEFLVSLLNRGFTTNETVDNVLRDWETKGEQMMTKPDAAVAGQALPATQPRPGFCTRMMHLFRRQALFVVRDPTMYTGRIVANILSCIWFGIMYISSRDDEQNQITNRIFLCLWCLGVPTDLILVAVFGHQAELVQVIMETKSGMYGVIEFILAQGILQIPLMIIVGIVAYSCGFVIGNFDASNFVVFGCIYTLTYWAFECAAQSLAARAMHVLMNMMDYANIWFAAFLFCGIMINVEDVHWPLKFFTYIYPFRYGLRSLVYNLIEPQNGWEGAVNGCSLSSSNSGYTCAGSAGPFTSQFEFGCESLPTFSCFGSTGCQVLESVGAIFPNISCTNHTKNDMLYLIIQIAAWKLIFVMTLLPRIQGLKPLQLQGSKKAGAIAPTDK